MANSRSIEALHLAKLLSGWTSSPLLIWGADLGRIRLPYRLFDVLIYRLATGLLLLFSAFALARCALPLLFVFLGLGWHLAG